MWDSRFMKLLVKLILNQVDMLYLHALPVTIDLSTLFPGLSSSHPLSKRDSGNKVVDLCYRLVDLQSNLSPVIHA